MQITKEQIVEVLSKLTFTTTFYKVPLKVVNNDELQSAAEQILKLLQSNDEVQPNGSKPDVLCQCLK